jgi:hypothetical protein
VLVTLLLAACLALAYPLADPRLVAGWCALGPAGAPVLAPVLVPTADGGSAVAPGVYRMTTRVCSDRGVCTTTSGTVTVHRAPPAATDRSASAAGRGTELSRAILGVVLAAARQLVTF